jgi:uncharacterized surface protein with fasciclin (FAS1) repeats
MRKPVSLRTFVQTTAVAGFILLSACASVPSQTNVVDTAARTPQLSTLSQLINSAGLADTLRGAGPFTVFAPSDEAFKAVPPETLAKLAGDKEALRALLTYHVLPGKVMAADVQPGNAKTVQGANLALSKAGGFVTVEDAMVQTADVATSNGVVHIIDRVLMPPKK